MNKYDPNEWTTVFVRNNKKFCFSFLQDTNQEIIEYLKKGEYETAVAGIDRMLNGAVVIQNAGVANMKPFLCTYSFNIGVVVICGVERGTEINRRNIAISNFLDAIEFSNGGLKVYAQQAVDLLRSNRNMDDIKNELCPNFPQDLINLMCDMGQKLVELK